MKPDRSGFNLNFDDFSDFRVYQAASAAIGASRLRSLGYWHVVPAGLGVRCGCMVNALRGGVKENLEVCHARGRRRRSGQGALFHLVHMVTPDFPEATAPQARRRYTVRRPSRY